MRVLITGNRGFVGRNLEAAFQARGDEVTGVDLADGLDALDFFRYGIMSCDVAIHCAAHIGGRADIDNSPLKVATNLALDAWFFRWLELSGTPKAVYFSSSAAYPVHLQNDADLQWHCREDDIGDYLEAKVLGTPDQTYGLAKLAGEQLAGHARQAGCEVTVVRPFSGYGPDQSLDYPFPSFIDRAARRADPFEIWGDGGQTRDFVHISDVVDITLALLDAGEPGPVNIGTGRAVSFNDLARLVIEACGADYRPEIRHLPGKPSGVRYRVADTNSLRQLYGKPLLTLEQGIEQALVAVGRLDGAV
jgi:nucleoside-diphosphate-sugar epimerase